MSNLKKRVSEHITLLDNYKLLFDKTPISITLLDLNSVIIDVNSSTENLLGFKREKLIGNNFTDLYKLSPKEKAPMNKIFAELVKGSTFGPEDIQVYNKDKKFIWVNIFACKIEIGKKFYIQVLTQDISQRKLLERRIEESERRYRGLYESSPIALTLTDSNGVILDVNSATEKIFGLKKSEVIGKKYFELGIFSQEQIERFTKDYEEALKGKKISPREVQIKRKDGTNAWLSVQNSLKKIGNEILIEGITQDITERKKAGLKLIKSEEKYRKLADSLPEVIFEIDLSYNITYTNSIATKIFGYSNEEFKKGMKIFQFVSFDDKESALKQTQQLFKGEYLKPLVLKLKRKDGTFFFANIYASRIFKHKKVVGVRCIIHDITEMKITQEKLIESQKKYKDLANSLPEVIFEIDLKFNLTYTNAIASKIFGYSHEDFKKGLNIFNFISSEDKKRVLKNLSRIFKGEFIEPIILQLRKKDNSFFYGTINATPIFKGSKIVGMRSVIHDVTEMVNAEEKIKESEAKFRTISEQSLMGISIIQGDRVKYVNKTLSDIFGYSIEEVLSWSPGEFFKTIHPKDKKRVIELSTKTDNGIDNGVRYYEVRGIHKNGNIIWLEIYSKVITIQKKPAILVSYIDISERKKAKEELRESEEKYRFLFEKSPTSILLINSSGMIVDCNPALEKLIDYDRTELIGKSYSKLPFMPSKYLPVLLKRFKQLSDGESTSTIDLQLIKKDGSLIWVNYESSLVKMGDKKYIMVMGRDISEKKEVEIKLKELNEMRKEFIDRASHELKTPITTVYGAYQLLDTLYKDKFDPEQLELIEMAFSGTRRIRKLVDDLLDVSKIDSNVFKLNKRKTNLGNLITNCVKEMRYFINKRNHEIIIDLEPELYLNIDESRIELVLTNLISNAIKYTPSKGKINIKIKSDEKFAQITIKDSGVGLTKKEIEGLFKKFSRVKSPLKKDLDMDLGSTGLGLYISKEIIKLHEGEIWAESEGKGKGSTFTVKIPVN